MSGWMGGCCRGGWVGGGGGGGGGLGTGTFSASKWQLGKGFKISFS